MERRTTIEAHRSVLRLDLKELVAYKDLLFTLAHRDLRVRYAQSFLGLLWAFVQPTATLIIFTVIFSFALKLETPNNTPYALYASAGLIAWTFFAFVMTHSGNSYPSG